MKACPTAQAALTASRLTLRAKAVEARACRMGFPVWHPSETVGGGNLASLMSSLDGEEFQAGRAFLGRIGVCLNRSGRQPPHRTSWVPIEVPLRWVLKYPRGGWSVARNAGLKSDLKSNAREHDCRASLSTTPRKVSGPIPMQSAIAISSGSNNP